MQSGVEFARRRLAPLSRMASVATAVAALVLGVVVATGAALAPPAAAATPSTVVTLTFDDGTADQMQTVPILQSAGMAGTYYVITGSVGAPGYLSMSDVNAVARAGNEIGGHTVNHLDLTSADNDEDKRQVCKDLQNLRGWGFLATSMAYPFAGIDAGAKTAAGYCGFNSSRGLGDVRSRFGCFDCDYAESLPPRDPYELRALDQVDATWTLADLQSTVTNAERHGGGWVILTFHRICADGCDPLAITPTLFAQFVSWLAQHRSQTPTTAVKTIHQTVGNYQSGGRYAPEPPAVSGAASNGSLEALDMSEAGRGLPTCWSTGSYGTLTGSAAVVSTAHSGSKAVRLTNTSFVDGGTQLLSRLDAGQCSPGATVGKAYQITAWYQGSGPAQLTAYYRTAQGGYQYWSAGPVIAPSASWAQTGWTTPPLPAGATGVSFGITLNGLGSMTVDQFTFAPSSSPAITSALADASLESAAFGAPPMCWSVGRYGDNNGVGVPGSVAHTGKTAVSLSMTQHADGAVQLVTAQDAGTCSPSAIGGHAYQVSAWYQGSGPAQLVAYYRDAAGAFRFWSAGPVVASSASWMQTGWITPDLPVGATAISFGMALIGVGTVLVDDFGFVDVASVKSTAMGNAGLETAGFDGAAACWAPSVFGDNNGTVAITAGGRTGSKAATVTIAAYGDGAAGLLPQLDSSTCAPAAVPGATYAVTAYYKATAASRFLLYYRDSGGVWHYWTESSDVGPSSTWTQARFTTPTVPAGATAISFSLSLMGIGTLMTDDYGVARS